MIKKIDDLPQDIFYLFDIKTRLRLIITSKKLKIIIQSNFPISVQKSMFDNIAYLRKIWSSLINLREIVSKFYNHILIRYNFLQYNSKVYNHFFIFPVLITEFQITHIFPNKLGMIHYTKIEYMNLLVYLYKHLKK